MADPKVKAEALAGELTNTGEPSAPLLTPGRTGFIAGLGTAGLGYLVYRGIRWLATPRVVAEAFSRAIGIR